MLLGIAGNVLKQNALFPPPQDPSMATEEEAGRAGRNFIRGALLGVGATVAGVLLFGAPEYLAAPLKLPPSLTEPGLIVSVWLLILSMTAYNSQEFSSPTDLQTLEPVCRGSVMLT